MRWKAIFLLVFIVNLVPPKPAIAILEAGEWWWIRSIGWERNEVIKDVKVLQDGSIITVGYTDSSGAGNYDVLVMKFSPDGSILWAKTYGGPKDDIATAVDILPNGDIVVVAGSDSFSPRGKDIWVLKLDRDGNLKWKKRYSGKYTDWPYDITTTSDGDIVVVGYCDGREEDVDGDGDKEWASDLCVLRINSLGNLEWAMKVGGQKSDSAYAVAVDRDGNIVVAGSTENFGASIYSTWVLKLNGKGDIIWQRLYSKTPQERPSGVLITKSGDIIVVGYTNINEGGDIWIFKLDSNGKFIWGKAYGGSHLDLPHSTTLDKNGNIIVVGETRSFGIGSPDSSNVLVLVLDENGDALWSKVIGKSKEDIAYGVASTGTGRIVLAGYSRNFEAVKNDALLIKLTPYEGMAECTFCTTPNLKVESVGSVTTGPSMAQSITPEMLVKEITIDVGDLDLSREKAKEALDRASLKIEIYESSGINLISAKEILDRAKTKFTAGNYTEAYILALQCVSVIDEITSEYNRAKPVLEEAESLIEYLKGNDVVFDEDLISIFNQAQEEFTNGNYNVAYSLANKIIQEAEPIKENYERAKSQIEEAKSLIETYREEIVMTSAETLLKQATDSFYSGDYETAVDLSKQALDKAREIKSQYEKAKPKLKEAKEIAGEYKRLGIFFGNTEILLNKAVDYFASGNYSEAYTYAEKFIEQAKELKIHYDSAKSKIEEVESVINSYKETGAIFPMAEDILEKAKKFFKEGDYVKAEDQASLALEEVRRMYESYTRTKPIIEETAKIVEMYKSQGIVVTPAEGLLNEAKQLFQLGEYDKAYEYAIQAKEKVENIKSQYERAKEAISQAEGFLSPIGNAKIAFGKGDYITAYQLAIEAKEKRDTYHNALKIIAVVMSLLLIALGIKTWKDEAVYRLLSSVESEFDNINPNELPSEALQEYKTVEELLAKAKEELKANQKKKAEEFLHQASEGIRGITEISTHYHSQKTQTIQKIGQLLQQNGIENNEEEGNQE